MTVIAAVLLVAFGLLHASALRSLRSSPPWLRAAWLACSLATVVAALAVFTSKPIALAAGFIGVVGLCALAVINGFQLHGKPTWSHHVIRGLLAAVTLGLLLAA